jgi:hypothetical protein
MADATQLLQTLLQKFTVMEGQIATLQQALLARGPPVPEPYPDEVSVAALQRLHGDENLPDFVRPSVEAMAFALEHLTDEVFPPLAQKAYAAILTATQVPPPAEDHPHPGRGRSPGPRSAQRPRQPSPSRFVQRDGVTYYRSNGGKEYDAAKPPPYPCRDCQHRHWYWQWWLCSAQHTQQHQNSSRGEPIPGSAPPSQAH